MSIPKYIWSDGLNDEDYIWSDGIIPEVQKSYVWSDGTLNGSYVWSDGTYEEPSNSVDIVSTQMPQEAVSYSGDPNRTISLIESFQAAQVSEATSRISIYVNALSTQAVQRSVLREFVWDHEIQLVSTQEAQSSRVRSSEDLGELGDIVGRQADQSASLYGWHYAGNVVVSTQYPQSSSVQIGSQTTPNYVPEVISTQAPQESVSRSLNYVWVGFSEIYATQSAQSSELEGTHSVPIMGAGIISTQAGQQVQSIADASVPIEITNIISVQKSQRATLNSSAQSYSDIVSTQAVQESASISLGIRPIELARIESTQIPQESNAISSGTIPEYLIGISSTQETQRSTGSGYTPEVLRVVSTQEGQSSRSIAGRKVTVYTVFTESTQAGQTSVSDAQSDIPEYILSIESSQTAQSSGIDTSWTAPTYSVGISATQVPQVSQSLSEVYRVAFLSDIDASQASQWAGVNATYLMPDGTSVIRSEQVPQSSTSSVIIGIPEYDISIVSTQAAQWANVQQKLPDRRCIPKSNPFAITSVDWTTFIPTTRSVSSSIDYDINVTLVPDWNTSMYISWEVPEELGTGDPLFNIYASSSEAGPFVKITEDSILDNQYTTNWTNHDSKVYEEYFTVEISYEDGSVFRSYPKSPSVNLPRFHILRYRDIIRRESILLEKFVGVDTMVYIPKTYGLRCRECYDTVHQKLMHDHCETCFGTGFQCGYNNGILTKISYSPRDPDIQHTYFGSSESLTITAWTIPYPYIPPYAILIRVDDRKAYRVESHRGTTEMLTIPQKQSFVLRELSKDAVENGLIDDSKPLASRPAHVHH